MDLYTWLEMTRVVCYAANTLMALYLCIEFANLHDRPLAALLGALSMLSGMQLTTVAVRYMGMSARESTALLTPTVIVLTVTLAVVTLRAYRRKRVTGRG